MLQLSNRLWMLASLVTPGMRLVDVGTDHGYVPIALCERGLIPSALAMDINRGPLLRADEHIRKAGLSEKIETRLSDGLDAFSDGEGDSLLIAGMGGTLIVSILERGSGLLPGFSELILSPHSDVQLVRGLLVRLHYHIDKECFLKEEGKYYPAIHATVLPAEEENDLLSEAELYFGPRLLADKNPVLLEFLQKEQKVQKDLLLKLEEADTSASLKRAEEVRGNLAIIQEALLKFEM